MGSEKDIGKKNILWVHNFSGRLGEGGVWMFNQYKFIKPYADIYYLAGLRNPWMLVKHLVRIRKVSRRYRIVHAQYGSAVAFIASFAKCRKILSLKGSDWYITPHPSFIHRFRIYAGHLLTRIALPRFDHVIVMSEAMKSQIDNKFPGINTQVLVDPIDLDEFRPVASRERKIKRVLFSAVDLDNPVKRYDLALKSVEALKKLYPGVELVEMTDMPHTAVNAFINEIDVLLLTSTHEGWPNIVKEALACNKPFVSTRVSDLELIASQTKSCFTCDPTPRSLSEGLLKALNSEKEDLRRFVLPFNMKHTITELRGIYSQF